MDDHDLGRWHDDGGPSENPDPDPDAVLPPYVGFDQLGMAFGCSSGKILSAYLQGRNDLIDVAVAALKRGSGR